MKEKNDFLPLKVAISFYADDIVCSRQDALKAMNEYAEEYAKAFAYWLLTGNGESMREIEEYLENFKESLKK